MTIEMSHRKFKIAHESLVENKNGFWGRLKDHFLWCSRNKRRSSELASVPHQKVKRNKGGEKVDLRAAGTNKCPIYLLPVSFVDKVYSFLVWNVLQAEPWSFISACRS
jgi:hypothetical protein